MDSASLTVEHRRRMSVDHVMRHEEVSKLVVLGEVSALQIALRRTYHLTNVYFPSKRNSSKSAPNALSTSDVTIEAEDDDDDFLYDVSGSHQPGASHATSSVNSMYFSLKQLKEKLTKSYNVFNDPSYLKPFCEVIRNKEISGPITGLALQSILKFLNYGLIDYCEDTGAAQLIGESVTKARFIGTDTSSDEVVLLRILNVLKELIVRGFKKLSDETVCEIMQSCFRITFEPRLSELLRKNAEQALTDMCRTLFAIIDTVEEEINLEDIHTLRISFGVKQGPFGKRIKSGKTFGSPDHLSVQKSNNKLVDGSQETSLVVPKSSTYSLISIYELMCYLTSLTKCTSDNQNSDLVITVGLNLLIIGFETSIRFIGEKRSLLAIIKDDLCWNLLQLLQPDKPLNIFSLSMRLSFIIFTSLRCHLKYQLEAFIVKLMDIINTGNAPFEYREIALEYLYGCFQHINFFAHELFINYDSDPYASNLLEDILQLLSKTCFSTANIGANVTPNPNQHLFSPIQKCSLNALFASLRSLQKAELSNAGLLRAFDINIYESEIDQHLKNKTVVSPPSPEHVDVGVIRQKDEKSSKVVIAEPEIVTEIEKSDSQQSVISCERDNYHLKTSLKLFPNTLEGIQKLKQRKQLLWTASEQFNAKPTKGITFLNEHKLINGDTDIVNFLRDNSKLDKKQIGDYLANKKNLNILIAFVESFNFKRMRIDEALRIYLESFRLPGEAPLISLLLEQFAHHWHESNDCPFANEDAAFSLAYAIIMLNVDQHNTNVRRQTTPMTLEEFIANLRQVNNGKDFDSKMLKEIYFAIKNNEIIMPAEQHGIVRERYLWKCLLRRSETESGIYWYALDDHQVESESRCSVQKESSNQYSIDLRLLNAPIFTILWSPVIAAMTFMFDKINFNHNSGLARKILTQGFTCCALLCSRYGHLDNLVVNLCKFTSSGQSNPLSYYKSQVAAQCLFGIAREYANEIRESWSNIVELIITWFSARLLDDALEIEDFALGGKKVALKRNFIQKSTNKNMNEGTNFLSSFYSYFAGNQQSEQNGGDCSDGDQQQSKGISKQSDAALSENCSQSIHVINTYCQPLSIIEESKFLHIDSLLELIKALINASIDVKDEEGDDIEAFKLEMLLQIVLLNRDRVSVFWPQVLNYLLKLLRVTKNSNLLTERVISAVFRLTIRFSQRPDLMSDQAFILLHRMLVTFELQVIQKQSTAIALHSFLTHCHSYISRIEDWSIIFDLLLFIGIGFQPKRCVMKKEGSIEAINVQSETEEDLKLRDNNIRGYTSDSEIDVHSHRLGETSKNNPYQLITGCNVGTGKGSCFKILDVLAYEKCTEILALFIKEILPINVHIDKQADVSVASVTNMAVDTLRKFVEASVKIQSNHLRRNASENKRTSSKVKNRVRESVSRSSSDSEEEKTCQRQQQPKLSSVTEACALKLLDLMHFLHLNASFASSNMTNEYLWNTIWSPVLQGIALLCCDSRRPVRTCALTFLQRALLNHDLRILTAHQWENCFNKVMFPLLAKLLEPLNICDPIGMDDTRMRATNLLCKVFLQHLTPLLTLPTFTALWLTILDFMDKFMKAEMQTDVVKEAIPESLKNMLLVMDTAQCLSPSLAVITWDRIALFLPNLKDEILPPNSVSSVSKEDKPDEPVVIEEALTSVVIESETSTTFQQSINNIQTHQQTTPSAPSKGDYPWPAPCESKFNL